MVSTHIQTDASSENFRPDKVEEKSVYLKSCSDFNSFCIPAELLKQNISLCHAQSLLEDMGSITVQSGFLML